MNCPTGPGHQFRACPAAMIFAIASLTVKLAGLLRGGKSLKLSNHCATKACAGTRMNVRCVNQSA